MPVFKEETIRGHAVRYLEYPELSAGGFARAVFTTRKGGVSKPPYESFNLGRSGPEPWADKFENYTIAAGIFRAGPEDLVLGYQTHTANIRVVTEGDRGKGTVRDRDYTDVDGLVTNVAGLILLTQHADCTPVFLVDPVHKAVAAVHSGWRGTIRRIVRNALETMHAAFGTDPGDILAAIGPVIGGDCYEIGPEVADAFREAFGGQTCEERQFLRPGAGDRSFLEDRKSVV